MSEEEGLQESLDTLTYQAAEEMEKASKDMDSVGKIGGKIAGEEEAAAVVNPPAPEAASESQPPEEPPVDPGFLQKKYGDGNWEEADKGYLNLQETLKQERAQREGERQQYLQYIQSLQAPAATPAADPLKQLEDVGIPGDPLNAQIDARAAAKVQEVLGPLVAEAQAEALLQGRADYDPKEYQRANSWAQEDPLLKAQLSQATLEASTPEHRALIKEYTRLAYRQAHGAEAEKAIQANEATRQQVVEESRKDAGIVGAKNAPSRTPRKVDTNVVEEEEMERVKRLAALGYGQRAAGQLLGPSLPDEFFK